MMSSEQINHKPNVDICGPGIVPFVSYLFYSGSNIYAPSYGNLYVSTFFSFSSFFSRLLMHFLDINLLVPYDGKERAITYAAQFKRRLSKQKQTGILTAALFR